MWLSGVSPDKVFSKEAVRIYRSFSRDAPGGDAGRHTRGRVCSPEGQEGAESCCSGGVPAAEGSLDRGDTVQEASYRKLLFQSIERLLKDFEIV